MLSLLINYSIFKMHFFKIDLYFHVLPAVNHFETMQFENVQFETSNLYHNQFEKHPIPYKIKLRMTSLQHDHFVITSNLYKNVLQLNNFKKEPAYETFNSSLWHLEMNPSCIMTNLRPRTFDTIPYLRKKFFSTVTILRHDLFAT